MLGKTNSNLKSAGGGATVTAVNKTGAAISQGDKVWINDGSQVAGDSINIDVSSNAYNGPVINPLGTVAWANHNYYTVSPDSISLIGSTVVQQVNALIYNEDYLFSMSSSATDRIDGSNFTFNGAMIINSNYDFGTGTGKFVKRNYETNEILKTYVNVGGEFASSNITAGNYYVAFDNAIYRLSSNAKYVYTINEEASTYSRLTYTHDNAYTGTNYDTYPIGVTADQKYAICAVAKYNSGSEQAYLRIVEFVEYRHLKTLLAEEMPTDLQPYFSTKKGTITFNPKTGVLAIVTSPTDYIVMQYKNGVWNKLSVDLGYPTDADNSKIPVGVTFTNDMSRCAIGYSREGSYTGKLVNLTTVTGYVAVPYKPSNISAETVTGFAKGAASVDGSFEASVASAE